MKKKKRPLARPSPRHRRERAGTRAREMASRPEASFQQLCAVARRVIVEGLATLDESVEWKESIKDRLSAQGYLTPLNDRLYRAMDAVERILRRRPAPQPRTMDPEQLAEHWRRTKAEQSAARTPSTGFTSLGDLVRTIRSTSVRSSRT